MKSYAAYIDESGNHDLGTEKSGASRYFLVLAVLVPQVDVGALEVEIEKIRVKFFGTGEMKSSSVRDDRRTKIIEQLATLNFQFYAVAVDKERVNKDSGLNYKRSFIKFANGKLYSALYRNLTDVTIFADAHGSGEFARSFVKYIEDHHMPDLFSNNSVHMVDSKSHVLVQLADFLVGTVAKIYEEKSTPMLRKEFLNFLSLKRIRIDEWPPRFEIRTENKGLRGEMDDMVRNIAQNAAVRFLENQAQEVDIETRVQATTLSYLLFRASFAADYEYISTDAIIEHLHINGFPEVNKHYLRSNVVSKLRDKDVVIASSSRGYKIPTSYADVYGFAELVDGIASPLLARLQRADGIFDLGSAGKIKLLDEPRFKKLRLLLSHLGEFPVQPIDVAAR